MPVHYNQRRYDQAKIQAELAGATLYQGKPCIRDPEHITPEGTSLRDTIKSQCVLCRRVQGVERNIRKREDYAEKTS